MMMCLGNSLRGDLRSHRHRLLRHWRAGRQSPQPRLAAASIVRQRTGALWRNCSSGHRLLSRYIYREGDDLCVLKWRVIHMAHECCVCVCVCVCVYVCGGIATGVSGAWSSTACSRCLFFSSRCPCATCSLRARRRPVRRSSNTLPAPGTVGADAVFCRTGYTKQGACVPLHKVCCTSVASGCAVVVIGC